MLRHLKFSNFKSWPSLDMECGRITGIFGTNSSGKSSILQFLLMLKQTRESTDQNAALVLNGDYVNLGTIKDIAFSRNDEKGLAWSIGFRPRLTLDGEYLLDSQEERVDHGGEVKSVQGRVEAVSAFYECAGESISFSREKADSATIKIGKKEHFVQQKRGALAFLDSEFGKIHLIPSFLVPDDICDANKIYWFAPLYELFFDQLFYLGPLRQAGERHYTWPGSKPRDLGSFGEHCMAAIISHLSSEIKPWLRGLQVSFDSVIAQSLRDLGVVSNFRMEKVSDPLNLWRAVVKVGVNSPEVSLTDVGFGISQVLPVITLLHYVPSKSTVLLEQPEMHLHPLAQANLADFIIDVARERNLQIIVESHSEQFLLRLQRRVAEETIPADEIRLYFVDMIDGRSQLVKLDLDEFGSIRNWPKDFMGDAFGETAKAELARVKRRKRARGE